MSVVKVKGVQDASIVAALGDLEVFYYRIITIHKAHLIMYAAVHYEWLSSAWRGNLDFAFVPLG